MIALRYYNPFSKKMNRKWRKATKNTILSEINVFFATKERFQEPSHISPFFSHIFLPNSIFTVYVFKYTMLAYDPNNFYYFDTLFLVLQCTTCISTCFPYHEFIFFMCAGNILEIHTYFTYSV